MPLLIERERVCVCVFVCMCLYVYPHRSLRHAFLVERASSLPSVDGVLNLSAELPCCWPLLVKSLDVLQSAVGGGQIIGTYTHTHTQSIMWYTHGSLQWGKPVWSIYWAPSPSDNDGSINSIMYSTSNCRADRLDLARTYIITGRKSSAPWARPKHTITGNYWITAHWIYLHPRWFWASCGHPRASPEERHWHVRRPKKNVCDAPSGQSCLSWMTSWRSALMGHKQEVANVSPEDPLTMENGKNAGTGNDNTPNLTGGFGSLVLWAYMTVTTSPQIYVGQ